jgi:hypothetical protein
LLLGTLLRLDIALPLSNQDSPDPESVLPSIGARFPAPKCPVLPGELGRNGTSRGGLWLKNDFRYSLELPQSDRSL